MCETENFKTGNICGKQLIKMLILEISIKEIRKLFTCDNSSQVSSKKKKSPADVGGST